MADPAPPVRITLARLDPRLVDPVPAAGPHPTAEVVDLGPAGERVYRPVETADQKLGTLVRRIWTDKGGIGPYSTAGLEDALARAAAAADNDDGSTPAWPAQGDEGLEAELKGPVLDTDGMRAFKTEIWEQLEQAKHALSNFHHVLTLLLPPALTTPSASGAPPNEAYALPPHVPLAPSSFSTSLVAPPAASTPTSTDDPARALALLARKQTDLRRTAKLLAHDAAALQAVVDDDARGWAAALDARREGWGVGLRASEGGAEGGGAAAALEGRRDGKDWSVSYGLANAPVAFRSRHVAHLPPPLTSPSSSDAGPSSSAAPASLLVYPARPRKRLRVVLERTAVDGGAVDRRVSRIAHGSNDRPGADGQQANGGLEEARREAVDEEVFNEVLSEARQSSLARPSRMTATSVALDASPGVVIVVELVSTDAPPAADDGSPPDALATLLLSHLTSTLVALHAYRLASLHSSLLPLRDPTRPVVSRPRFLPAVVERVQGNEVEDVVRGLVGALGGGARAWGGELDVRWKDGGRSKEKNEKPWRACEVSFDHVFSAAASGPVATIKKPDGKTQPLKLVLLPPTRIFARLPPPELTGVAPPSGPRAPVAINDVPHLRALLAGVLHACLVRGIVRFVQALEAEAESAAGAKDGTRAKRKTCCFADNGKGVAVLQWTHGQILARPNLVFPSPPSPSSPATAPTLTLSLTVQRPTGALPPMRDAGQLDYSSAGGAQGRAGEWLAREWTRVSSAAGGGGAGVGGPAV